MPENELEKNNDDEISLVDLFVILLKYRRMIAVFVVLGLAVSVCYYVVQAGENEQEARPLDIAYVYEGCMTVMINPRIGRSGTDQFPPWFNSGELLGAALKEAGLEGATSDSFTVTYQNNGVNIILKPVPGYVGQIEKLFSSLLGRAESMASAYYAQYAADIITYFESLQELGKDYSAQDYIRYQWAQDLLSGRDTVLKALYPPSISGGRKTSGWGSPRVVSLVIFFASLFFAVFLAFALNAFKNIGADDEVRAKIRGVLGRGKKG
ncbi:MAG: hypothetical protein LBJ24_08630 [Treponema sp.]|jgi:hypothetical protein|nr:hypothetical protein [Treponema sp.]